MLAEIAREHNAELVRERLKDLKNNNKKRSKQLNYRLSISIPQVRRVH